MSGAVRAPLGRQVTVEAGGVAETVKDSEHTQVARLRPPEWALQSKADQKAVRGPSHTCGEANVVSQDRKSVV